MSVKVNINAQNLINRLNKIKANISTLPWMRVGEVVRDSVHTNFDAGGRPARWVKRKKDQSHPILIKSGKLKNSIYVEEIKDGVSVGTRLPYQAVHNFGYPQRNIPQREYLMVQDVDRRRIESIIRNHISKK